MVVWYQVVASHQFLCIRIVMHSYLIRPPDLVGELTFYRDSSTSSIFFVWSATLRAR